MSVAENFDQARAKEKEKALLMQARVRGRPPREPASHCPAPSHSSPVISHTRAFVIPRPSSAPRPVLPAQFSRPCLHRSVWPVARGRGGTTRRPCARAALRVSACTLGTGGTAAREMFRSDGSVHRAQEAGHDAPHFCTDPLMATLAHFDTDQARHDACLGQDRCIRLADTPTRHDTA
jgi:hypothetical protein